MAKKAKTKKTKEKSKESYSWTTPETRGILLVSAALLLILSLISFALNPHSKNLIGILGDSVGWILHALIGISSYLIAIYLGWVGIRLILNRPYPHPLLEILYLSLMVTSCCILFSLVETSFPSIADRLGNFFYPALWTQKLRYHLGGALFFYLYEDLPYYNLHRVLNSVGAGLIFSGTFFASLLFLCNIRLVSVFIAIKKAMMAALSHPPIDTPPEQVTTFANLSKPPKEAAESDFLRFVKLRIPQTSPQEHSAKANTLSGSASSPDLLGIQPEKNLQFRPSLSRKTQTDIEIEPIKVEAPVETIKEAEKTEALTKARKRETALIAQSVHNGDFTQYQIPSVNLLSNARKVDQTSLKKDLKKQAEVLEETLLSFGIEAKVGQINCGPTITSFEVHPAIGVKVQKIKTLDNDIALNMEAKSIRIIAPIPGKAAVGIEVPNSQPQEVGFKDMLTHYQQGSVKFNIPILLGKAVNGDYVMSDLAKMPHCIIAGATGSGKSVCINTIIMSIILNARPDQIKLIMVDPKKVELTPYSRLPHMLAPVITEPQGAAAALNWLVREMESRYETLKLLGLRNIEGFNKRTIDKEREATLGKEIPAFMPFMVGIIDELADLMMVASQDIETPIARIAQMARAVGIHLILATQRPSREVITGLIKANFPTRISFKVASRVNSQIVLDEIGAETLLGNGDMLFLPPGSSHLTRAQGAFIRDEDIQSVIDFICKQAPPNYVIQSFDQFSSQNALGGGDDEAADRDSLYDQAKDIITSTGNASTTFLQRKLKIGYARAASLMDQLESQGIVGPAEGSKPRKIFAKRVADSQDGEEDDLIEE